MKKFTLLLLLCGSIPCFARLGETVEQSKIRYGDTRLGTELSPAPDCMKLIFWKDGILIEARFFKGICCDLKLKKTNPPGNDPNPPASDFFTKEEDEVLLKQNAQRSAWGSGNVSDDGKHIYWNREDGGFAADSIGGFEIEAPENKLYSAAIDQIETNAKAKAAEKKLEGL